MTKISNPLQILRSLNCYEASNVCLFSSFSFYRNVSKQDPSLSPLPSYVVKFTPCLGTISLKCKRHHDATTTCCRGHQTATRAGVTRRSFVFSGPGGLLHSVIYCVIYSEGQKFSSTVGASGGSAGSARTLSAPRLIAAALSESGKRIGFNPTESCDAGEIKLGARLQETRLELHSEKRRQLLGDKSINVELRVSPKRNFYFLKFALIQFLQFHP